MGVATGLQTVWGFGEETTFGTAVTPTRFLEISQESLELKKNVITSKAIRPGGYNPMLNSRRIVSSRSAAGDFNVDVTTKSIGLLLKYLMGPALSPAVTSLGGSPAAYLHTYLLGLSGGKSLTIQKQLRDNTGSVVQAFDYTGSKITKGEFTVGVDGMLELSCSVDARTEAKQASPASSSYGSGNPFYFAEAALTIGGSPVSALVKSASVALERPMDVDRRGLGNGGYKSEQSENDFPKLSGKLSAEFASSADFYDAFAADTSLALVLTFTGATISGANPELFRMTIPALHLDGESPKVKGAGTVAMDVPWTGLFDGTNSALKLEYQTTDTAP